MRILETHHSGYHFRSRIEARWAVFFETLGIPYEYEREGFDLDGLYYLPDFWLPNQRVWIEIKGDEPTSEERERVARLAAATGLDAFMFWGGIPSGGLCEGESAVKFFGNDGTDQPYAWCECPRCHNLSIQYGGLYPMRGCHCGDAPNYEERGGGDAPQIIAAYQAARGARFEFSERAA